MRKKTLTMASFFIVSGFLVATIGNGCGQDFTTQNGGSTGNNTATGGGLTPEDDPIIPGRKTVSFVYSNQVLDQLTSCVGVTKPSELTLQTYASKKGSISVTGAANTITPPMMMAITTIAGEVCNDLINQEATSPRILSAVDLSANTPPSVSSLNDVISKMALSCWNRYETQDERNVLVNMVLNSVANENQASRKASLMVCTAMLSSVDALLN